MCRVPRRQPRPAWVIDRRRALGDRIRVLREAAGLSQDDLADRSGHERRSIQRYENAVRDPQYGDLLLIAKALDVSIADLVAEQPPQIRAGESPG